MQKQKVWRKKYKIKSLIKEFLRLYLGLFRKPIFLVFFMDLKQVKN